MNKSVTVKEEPFVLPAYSMGAQERHPMFAEEYNYHTGRGSVYPYRLRRAFSDTKAERTFCALCLENEYIRLVIVPELGGRIMRAVNKVTDTDFLYAAAQIQPELIGETGAAVVGGIDFFANRGDTLSPVNARTEQNMDGSGSVWLQRMDEANGVRQSVKITLFPERAYVQITGRLYNTTPLRQQTYYAPTLTVVDDDHAQAVFPMDTVSAHTDGLCRVAASDYDFIGNYLAQDQAGVLQISDHYLTPQRRRVRFAGNRMMAQLTSGSFENGHVLPIQLAPFEERRLVQYLMPYRGIAAVRHATREIAVGLETGTDTVTVSVYSARSRNVRVVLTDGMNTLFEDHAEVSPADTYEKLYAGQIVSATQLRLIVYDSQTHKPLISYREPMHLKDQKEGKSGRTLQLPEKIRTNDELYMAGRWIEERRPSGYQASDYYLEGIRRDSHDVRMNQAYGEWLLAHGDFEAARKYLIQALHDVYSNSGTQTGNCQVSLGVCELYMGKITAAQEAFSRSLQAEGTVAYGSYFLAALAARRGIWTEALEHVGKVLSGNAHHIQARGLQAYLLRRIGQDATALRCCRKNLEHDPFDFVSANELVMLGKSDGDKLVQIMGNSAENYLSAARDYILFGAYEEAVRMLISCPQQTFLVNAYRAYALVLQKKTPEAQQLLQDVQRCEEDEILPNHLEDIAVLEYAANESDSANAHYELGCLWYARGQRKRAIHVWENAAKRIKQARIYRNLALAYANVEQDLDSARREMEKAFYFNVMDAEVFWELEQLEQRLGRNFEQRLENYERHLMLVETHDELYTSYLALLNITGQFEKAHDCVMRHSFHLWEGCREAVAAQYTWSLLEMANRALVEEDALLAERYLMHAMSLPETIGICKRQEMADTRICYHLGLALELQEKNDQAEESYKKAAETQIPEQISYFDDLAGDQLLFQGLSLLKLGDDKRGYACFDRLISEGELHVEDEPGRDCVKILPAYPGALQIDHAARCHAHCHYFMALGYLGYGDHAQAQEHFEEAVRCEPENIYCRMYANV